MPIDNKPAHSKRTQLTDRPKLALPSTGNTPIRGAKQTGTPATPARSKPKPRPNRPMPAKPKPGKPAPKATGKPQHRGKSTGKTTLNSRRVCYDLLVAVAEGAQLDAALAANTDLSTLEDRDRRFVRLLATTCLRRRGQLDKAIAPMLSRRPFGAQEHANIILAMGAAQVLVLKTEPHAAVDSTVELMRQAGFDRLTGMANAVMRRLTREGEARYETTAATDNLPDWLRTSWQTHYGQDATAAMTELAMQTPPLDITVKRDAGAWSKTLEGTVINETTVRRSFDGDVTQLDGFGAGEWWVQDAAAALPATLLGDISGKTVIDLCAAPGGKTAQLLAAGAIVTAIDNGRKRVDRLRRNLKRLKLDARIIYGDGRTYQPEAPVDHILLDAPCSATGTFRRRPDILMRRTADNIAELQAMQWDLATTALGWLKPGGTLIYATCSLQPEEGEEIIKSILAQADNKFAIDPVTPSEAGDFAASITGEGTLRILPSDYVEIGGVDGFYIARLKSLS